VKTSRRRPTAVTATTAWDVQVQCREVVEYVPSRQIGASIGAMGVAGVVAQTTKPPRKTIVADMKLGKKTVQSGALVCRNLRRFRVFLPSLFLSVRGTMSFKPRQRSRATEWKTIPTICASRVLRLGAHQQKPILKLGSNSTRSEFRIKKTVGFLRIEWSRSLMPNRCLSVVSTGT
jgi:hypothetical protein